MCSATKAPDWARLIQVFSKACDRMQVGSRTYGEYDPKTDQRDMYDEAKEELLDAIVYLGMEYMRLEELQALFRFPATHKAPPAKSPPK